MGADAQAIFLIRSSVFFV